MKSYLFESFNDKLDFSKIKILGVLGAGTVNVALEYLDLKMGEEKVLYIPREKIEARTNSDFICFENFTKILAKRSRPGVGYTFISGLVGSIKRSWVHCTTLNTRAF